MMATYYPLHTWMVSFFSGVLLANIQGKTVSRSLRWVLYPTTGLVLLSIFTSQWPKQLLIVFGFAFIFSVNFIIFACFQGFGGAVNRVLSHKLWTPLAKMSLSFYLIAPILQLGRLSAKNEPFTAVTDFGTVWL
jgi:hypothetical protein